MNELGLRIVADAASMQMQCSVADARGWHSRDANVDRFSSHVLAVFGHSRSGASKEFVAPGSAIAAHDIDFCAGAAQRRGEVAQQIEESRVQIYYIPSSVIAEKMIEPIDRIGKIQIALLIYDIDPLARVQMKQQKPMILVRKVRGGCNPRRQKQTANDQESDVSPTPRRTVGVHFERISQRRPSG